jgi:hypothetical protein
VVRIENKNQFKEWIGKYIWFNSHRMQMSL